jgi:hypothetical protein
MENEISPEVSRERHPFEKTIRLSSSSAERYTLSFSEAGLIPWPWNPRGDIAGMDLLRDRRIGTLARFDTSGLHPVSPVFVKGDTNLPRPAQIIDGQKYLVPRQVGAETHDIFHGAIGAQLLQRVPNVLDDV